MPFNSISFNSFEFNSIGFDSIKKQIYPNKNEGKILAGIMEKILEYAEKWKTFVIHFLRSLSQTVS